MRGALAPVRTHGLTHAPLAPAPTRHTALTMCQAEGHADPQRVVAALRKEEGSKAYGIREGFTVTDVAPRSGNTANGLVLTYINPQGKVLNRSLVTLTPS